MTSKASKSITRPARANYLTTLELIDGDGKVAVKKVIIPNDVPLLLGGSRMPGDLFLIVGNNQKPGKNKVRLTVTDKLAINETKSFEYAVIK